MSDDLKARADERLEAALAEAGVRDPRPFYRPALKHLREHDPAAFTAALEHYEQELVPAAAGDADPLAAWARYGRVLAAALGAGREVSVDGTGRALPAADAGDGLVLHLPDDDGAPALVLRCPVEPTAPQQATLELLVAGRVTASAYA